MCAAHRVFRPPSCVDARVPPGAASPACQDASQERQTAGVQARLGGSGLAPRAVPSTRAGGEGGASEDRRIEQGHKRAMEPLGPRGRAGSQHPGVSERARLAEDPRALSVV